jgi:hypothetical protein
MPIDSDIVSPVLPSQGPSNFHHQAFYFIYFLSFNIMSVGSWSYYG